MKILETVTIRNPEKVFMGDKDIKLTFDTDTGRLVVDTPAMFTDPIVNLSELQEKLAKLAEHDGSR